MSNIRQEHIIDIIVHAAWGGVITRRRNILLGCLFGTLPDLLGGGGLLGWIPYHCSHSLLALVVVTALSFAIWRTFLFGAAYGAHLLMDVFAHQSGTFNLFYVPFLWRSIDPLHYHGENWWGGGLWMELCAWGLVLILWLPVLIRMMKKKPRTTTKSET